MGSWLRKLPEAVTNYMVIDSYPQRFNPPNLLILENLFQES